MFCTKCGKAIPDGTSFCTGCGTPVQRTTTAMPRTPSANAGTVPPAGCTAPVPLRPAVPAVQPNRVLLIVSAALILLNLLLSFADMWKAGDLLGMDVLSVMVDSAPLAILGEAAEDLPFLYLFIVFGFLLAAASVLFLLLPLAGKIPYSKVCLLPAAVLCALALLFIVGFCGILGVVSYNANEMSSLASLRPTFAGVLLLADTLALPFALRLLHKDIKRQSGGVGA